MENGDKSDDEGKLGARFPPIYSKNGGCPAKPNKNKIA